MKTFGKIAGAWGLLLLLPSPLVLFLSGWPYALGMGGLGIVGVGFYIATHLDRLKGEGAPKTDAIGGTARSGFYYSTSILIAGVAIALLGAVNFIVAKRGKTYDLTAKKIYSLAPQTLSTLKELKDPVEAIAFLPKDHPAYDALDSLLKKYASESDKFTYGFKDPRKTPDLAAKYQLKEGQTTVVLTKGSGASETHTSLSIISEQELTNALIKLNKVGEQKVYFIVGHGEWTLEAPPPGQSEPSLQSASELKRSLEQEGYAPAELNLAEKPEIPKDASLLIDAGAKSKFADAERAALEKYLGQGGRLLFFAENGGEPGLDDLLGRYGVAVDKGLLVDERINPDNPYVIASPFFGDHEITRILKTARLTVEFPTTRGLSMVKTGTLEGVESTPIVTTSPYAWEETNPSERPHLDSGEKAGAIPMVVVSTRDVRTVAEKRFDETRVVVFGNAEILVDALWGHEPNRNLVMNAVAWASAQVQKITIRPPDRDISTIDLDEAMMNKIRFFSIAVLPLLLVGVGLSIWLTRRNK